jgi:hypothetical protein
MTHHHHQQHAEPEPEIEAERPPTNFKTQHVEEEDEKPPMGLRPPVTQNNASSGMQGMMAAPSYRIPHKKINEPAKKPAPFTPQNVQIVSGKTLDHKNPFNETEDDKRETPRRESGRSNASTPTREQREESIKQQHHVQPTHQPPQQQIGKIHNLAAQKPRIGNSFKIIHNFLGKNPFADEEESNPIEQQEVQVPPKNNFNTPPTKNFNEAPTKTAPFGQKGLILPKKEENKEKSPKIKKPVLSSNSNHIL